MTPVFIVKLGPPASGKSSIVEKCKCTIMKNNNKPCQNLKVEQIGINNFVEQNNEWKTKSTNLFKKIKNNNTKLQNSNTTREFQNLYMQAARKYYFSHDQELKNAIVKGKDIAYETTGKNGLMYIFKWLFSNEFPNNITTYQIVLALPQIDVNTAYNRYVNRATKSAMSGNGFRLMSTKSQYMELYDSIYKRFNEEWIKAKEFIKQKTNKEPIIVIRKNDGDCVRANINSALN